VISLFIVDKEAQFRKLATLTNYQGKGFGSKLLKEIIHIAKNNKLQKIWCSARINKVSYYTKFGMAITDKIFFKGGIKYVRMEKYSIN